MRWWFLCLPSSRAFLSASPQTCFWSATLGDSQVAEHSRQQWQGSELRSTLPRRSNLAPASLHGPGPQGQGPSLSSLLSYYALYLPSCSYTGVMTSSFRVLLPAAVPWKPTQDAHWLILSGRHLIIFVYFLFSFSFVVWHLLSCSQSWNASLFFYLTLSFVIGVFLLIGDSWI